MFSLHHLNAAQKKLQHYAQIRMSLYVYARKSMTLTELEMEFLSQHFMVIIILNAYINIL